MDGRLPLPARARAQRSISVIAGFSFAGIVLGVAALIVVMAVMNGFRLDLMDKIIGLNGHMFLQGVETPLTDYAAVTERVGKVPGVTLACRSSKARPSPLALRPVRRAGARHSREGSRAPAGRRRQSPRTLDGFDKGRGSRSARSSPSTWAARGRQDHDHRAARGQTPFGVTPRMKAYTVAAIFQLGMATFDSTFIFMPLAEAQTFFNYEGQANVIEVDVDDPDNIDRSRPRSSRRNSGR